MAIIALLAALVIAFFPAISSQTSESQGAANVQGWLNIARQKAIRNQQPFGLRFWVQSQNIGSLWVTDCQYVEQPDDFPGSTGSSITTGTTNVANDTIQFNNVDITGGFGGGSDPVQWPVQVGDNLEGLGTGLMHRIVALDGNKQQALLATATPFPITNGSNYRILRQPRVVGEETMPLPTGVYVDLGMNNIKYGAAPYNLPVQLPLTPVYAVGFPPPGNPPTGAYVDVLFSPSGSVITPNLTSPYMAFWVRLPDTNAPANEFAGTPSLIVVWSQTGLVGAYSPVPGNNPYVDVR